MTLRVECFDSVWDAIEDDPEVAADLERRSDLMIALIKYVREKEWTNQQASRQLDASEERIAMLLEGDIDSFNESNLLSMCRAAGLPSG